jgi:DNA-binding MarR family transcriptional regulator
MASPAPLPDEPADLTLDQQLCLALYTASRAMTARYRSSLARLGLTYPQYLVMLLLWEVGTCSVTGIGHRLTLDSSTLSPLLKRLQAMELVTRTRDERDERVVIVGLTERGRTMKDEAAYVPVEMCAATGTTRTEYLEMVDTLRALTEQLEASLKQLPSQRT